MGRANGMEGREERKAKEGKNCRGYRKGECKIRAGIMERGKNTEKERKAGD